MNHNVCKSPKLYIISIFAPKVFDLTEPKFAGANLRHFASIIQSSGIKVRLGLLRLLACCEMRLFEYFSNSVRLWWESKHHIEVEKVFHHHIWLYLKSLSWWEVKRWTLHTWSTKVEQIRPHVLCTTVYRGQNTQPNPPKRPVKVGILKNRSKHNEKIATTTRHLNFRMD